MGMLRGIFGANRDEVTGQWRKVHIEDLNDLYCSPNIIRIIKSRRMRWVGYLACVGNKRGVYRFGWGNLWETILLGDPGLNGR